MVGFHDNSELMDDNHPQKSTIFTEPLKSHSMSIYVTDCDWEQANN